MHQDLQTRYMNVKKQLFEKAYSFLNEMQRKAVFTTENPLLILAGAGSGKTTVLVSRIAFIIKYGNAYFNDKIPGSELNEDRISYLESILYSCGEKDEKFLSALSDFAFFPAKPWQVLSITFTNKAANEMKERLSSLLGEEAKEIWAGTFHSVCVKILRRYIDRLGYDSSFTIYDTDDTKKLMTSCIRETGIDEKQFPAKTVLNEISRSKDKLIGYETYAQSAGIDFRKKMIARLFELYEKKKAAANALDFDDIILFTVKLLSENEDVRSYFQNRFRYVLVDEYQDTNISQFYLIKLLCSGHNNIMVVGDDDQSIYKFRGATIENILSFDKSFSDCEVIKLEQNYRSNKNILEAANSIIRNNKGRKGKELWTENKDGELITIKECENQNTEASYIIDTISKLINEKGYSFGDFAVLYRMNAQSNTFETAFAKSGFPYRILGGFRFYDRQEIKDIIAYLCLINNFTDNLRLKRIINMPKRGIGDATVEEIERIAQSEGTYMLDIVKRSAQYPSLSRSAPRLTLFYDMISDMKTTADNEALPVLFEKVIEKSGYLSMLNDSEEEGKDRLDNIRELVSNAMQYSSDNVDSTLSGFLEEVSLISDVDNYDKNAKAVVLMTIHSAKGLEFPVVFLPGMEENIFPGTQSTFDNSELEEERRLAYVAVTRAKSRLFITHCRLRLLYGRTSFNAHSRFIDEIPPELCNIEGSYMEREVGFGKAYNTNISEKPKSYLQKPFSPSIQIQPQRKEVAKAPVKLYKKGDCVKHPTFGDGIIINTTPMGADTLYEVAFDTVGTKKIMGSYAKFL